MADRPSNTIVGHVQNGFLGRMMNFSPPAIVTWLALANRADESGVCYPSISTLQRDTGLARSTVYKAIDELVTGAEITVVSGGGGGNPSNEYHMSGGPRNELVQTTDQSKRRTKVVRRLDSNHTQEPNDSSAPAKRFVKPTIKDITAYCQERKNAVDAQRFWDYYESVGWRVGKNPMRDWRAAVRTWERNGFSNSNGQPNPPEPIKYRG